jgi:hypothetical protein
MASIKTKKSPFDPKLAASVVRPDGTLINRALDTEEWDAREFEREKAGCIVTSYGTVLESEDSKPGRGRSALYWSAAPRTRIIQ